MLPEISQPCNPLGSIRMKGGPAHPPTECNAWHAYPQVFLVVSGAKAFETTSMIRIYLMSQRDAKLGGMNVTDD